MVADTPQGPYADDRFRQLVEELPHIVFIADADGQVTFINRGNPAVFEHPTTLALGEGWLSFIHPEDRPAVRERWFYSIRTGEEYQCEFRSITESGDYRWYLSRAIPQRDASGHIREWYGTATDIHDLRRAQEALSEREEALERRVAELQAIYDGVPVGLGQFDRDLRWVEVNEPLARFNGAAVEAHIGRRPREIIPQIAERVERYLSHVIETGEPIQNVEMFGEVPGTPGVDGYWLSTYQPIRNEDGDILGVTVIVLDITDLRRAEETQEVLQTQLHQAQKMEAIGQLTAGVAHDFNNLLAVISGNLELLGERQPHRPDLVRLVEAGQQAVERGASLTRSLLAFSRRQPLHPQSIDVSAMIAGMEDLLARTLGSHIAVTVTTAEACHAEVDPAQLENAILNLAINARDAMPEGGQVMIEVNSTLLDSTDVAAHSELLPGDYVHIAVSDTGKGMNADVVARAFDPFFTTKEVGAGTGLGLSMVYGFAKQSGGHIKIYSEPDRGTTMKLYLPRTGPDSERPARDEAPAEALVPAGKTVLVVEDQGEVRSSVENLLESLGYTVLSAESAAEASEHLASQRAIDLLLTDVMLPGALKGPDLALRAQSSRPSLKVIYMTGYTEQSVLNHGAVQAGAHLLQKPFRKADLAEKIRVVFAEEDGAMG